MLCFLAGAAASEVPPVKGCPSVVKGISLQGGELGFKDIKKILNCVCLANKQR